MHMKSPYLDSASMEALSEIHDCCPRDGDLKVEGRNGTDYDVRRGWCGVRGKRRGMWY